MTARRALVALVVLAAVAGPVAGEWAEGTTTSACAYAALATLLVLAQVLPERAPGSLFDRYPVKFQVFSVLVVAWGIFLALRGGLFHGLLVVALLPAGTAALRPGRAVRDGRTSLESLGVAVLYLAMAGSAASLLGAAGAVAGLCVLLPVLLAENAQARARGEGEDAASGEDAEPAMPTASSRGTGRGLRTAAWALPATAALAAILFVALPRFEPRAGREPAAAGRRGNGPPPERGLRRGEAVTGLPGNEVSLGDLGRLHQDFRPILEVTILRKNRPSDAEDLGALFRSQALETFDGFAWRNADPGARLLRDADDGILDSTVSIPQRGLPGRSVSEHVEQRLRMLTPGPGALFHLGMPVRVGGKGAAAGVLALPRGEVRAPDFYGEGETFTVGSVVGHGEYPPLLDEVLDNLRRDALLAIPPGHEQAAALARGSLRDVPSGRATLRALEILLAKRCTYSLDIAPPGALSPVESFLFESRRGHCELFASTAAVMLRSVGIPARVAIGFRGGNFNPVLVKYTLRGSDAHAWVEAWLENEGWVTFDPTPSAPGAVRDAPPLEDEADASGGVRAWLRGVLGFDGRVRDRFLGRIAGGAGNLLATAFLDPAGGLRWSSVAAVLAALLLLLCARFLPRPGPPPATGAGALPPPLPPEAWGILLARFAEGGIHRTGPETARELADRALAAGAAPAGVVRRIVESFEAERWGARRPAAADGAALAGMARAVALPPR